MTDVGFAFTASPLNTECHCGLLCTYCVSFLFLPCVHSFVFGLLNGIEEPFIYELVVFKRELIKECLKNVAWLRVGQMFVHLNINLEH